VAKANLDTGPILQEIHLRGWIIVLREDMRLILPAFGDKECLPPPV
jgi:hypothetical protein